MTVLRNELQPGLRRQPEGRLRLRASREGFDFVAMVHGDGQYAPEELPQLVAPLRDGQADAVFGSRMMTPFGALKGGMPLYKFVGNRILTALQNALLRHAADRVPQRLPRLFGRGAATDPLPRSTPNDFHFDTEIIIQLLNAGQRIVELPIPTYYGDEICRVERHEVRQGRPAGDAAERRPPRRACSTSAASSRRTTHGQRALRPEARLRRAATSSRSTRCPPGAAVLDIGAGPGGIAPGAGEEGLPGRGRRPVPARRTPGRRRGLRAGSRRAAGASTSASYDYLLLLDVIEHLKDPEQFLDRAPRAVRLLAEDAGADHAQRRASSCSG